MFKKRKITTLFTIFILLITSSISISAVKTEQKISDNSCILKVNQTEVFSTAITFKDLESCESGDVWVVGWDPYEIFVIDPVQVAIEYQGKEWDEDCWEYKFKFMWWMAYLAGYEYADNPVFLFQMDYWPVANYGCWEGESFMYGGYNIQDCVQGDFEFWAFPIANALFTIFCTITGYPFDNIYALIDALVDTEDEDPIYTWYSNNNIWDVSGFFEYDFHVPANSTFTTSWWFEFGSGPVGSWTNGKGWRIYLDNWHSPPGPGVLEITPESANWEKVNVGEKGGAKKFYLTNTGQASVDINTSLVGDDDFIGVRLPGPDYTLHPGETCSISVDFLPESKGSKSCILKVDADECEDVEAVLTGVGKRSRVVNTTLFNLLQNFLINFPLLEKLICLN